MNLSARAYNRLVNSGYSTLGDLYGLSEKDLYSIPGLGKDTAENIVSAVNDYLGHRLNTMQKIMELRDKYDLHMKVERFASDDSDGGADRKYIRD